MSMDLDESNWSHRLAELSHLANLWRDLAADSAVGDVQGTVMCTDGDARSISSFSVVLQ